MPSTEQLVAKAIDEGVLDKKFHAPIIRRLEFFSVQTRVPVSYICSSVANHLSPDELKGIQKFYDWTNEGIGGLLVHGNAKNRSITSMFCAVAGWMIRNKIDARIYTLQELATDARLDGPGLPECRVLLIPDFHITEVHTNDWIRQTIDTIIYSRYTNDKFTILYCEDHKLMRHQYGTALDMHFLKTYKVMKI